MTAAGRPGSAALIETLSVLLCSLIVNTEELALQGGCYTTDDKRLQVQPCHSGMMIICGAVHLPFMGCDELPHALLDCVVCTCASRFVRFTGVKLNYAPQR